MDTRKITLIATIAAIALVAVGIGYAYTATTTNTDNTVETTYLKITQDEYSSALDDNTFTYNTETLSTGNVVYKIDNNLTTKTLSDTTYYLIGSQVLTLTHTGTAIPGYTLKITNSIDGNDNTGFTSGMNNNFSFAMSYKIDSGSESDLTAYTSGNTGCTFGTVAAPIGAKASSSETVTIYLYAVPTGYNPSTGIEITSGDLAKVLDDVSFKYVAEITTA